jgi:putative hemolysin
MIIPYQYSFGLGIAGAALAAVITAVRITLTTLSLGSVRKLEDTDPELARTIEKWLARRDEYRITLRLLLVADALLIALCYHAWAAHHLESGASHSLRTALSPLVIGAFLYFLASESLGLDLPRPLSRLFLRAVMPAIQVMSWIAAPVVWPLAAWHRLVCRRRETAAPEEEKTTTEDEIMSLVETDELREDAAADLEDDERRMIRGIFDLDETLVREIMTPRVDIDAIEADATIEEIRHLIVTSGHSRIPVYEESIDHIVGLVLAKDLLDEAKTTKPAALPHLLHPVIFIPESKNIGDLLAEFQQYLAHFAVVVDEYGGTAGIVTLEDILEEIVGEIQDEYDREEAEPELETLPDGSVIVDARTSISQLNELLDLNIPDNEDFDTLGGYVSFALGRIPEAGESLETARFSLEILKADQRRILKARLLRKSPKTEKPQEEKESREE